MDSPIGTSEPAEPAVSLPSQLGLKGAVFPDLDYTANYRHPGHLQESRLLLPVINFQQPPRNEKQQKNEAEEEGRGRKRPAPVSHSKLLSKP